MDKKLSEIIKEIEEKQGIDEFFLHRNYYDGSLELNIIFKNDIADETLQNSNIRENESCAFWE